MKIVVEEDAKLTQVEVTFRAPKIDAEVIDAVSRLKLYEQKITGIENGTTHIVPAKDVLYFDSVDKHTFFYTATNVFETPMRLYEIEDKLAGCGFVRVGKSCVINLKKVECLQSDIGGRLIATLSNGEKTVISRAYAQNVKLQLGIK